MREDIFGGLRNAIDRGYSVQDAVKSFINAGYKESDIQDAAKELNLNFGATLPMIKQSPPIFQVKTQKPAETFKKPFEPNWIIIILSSLLAISIIIFILSLFFKNEIISFISNLSS